ncbi:hypothetical protein [Leptospira bouyouniensis]|uniref:DUF1564 family protein n=1 Tax=Leptospira bouyouniensis TaxID=2484911 RepID=A0ABY2KZB1_9LEPT|nr:hypothetical protein [Leptospira bouyouniensis]TGK45933.1 hypothetical protein EHQ10_18705 [Leptospira bouyouniensis]
MQTENTTHKFRNIDIDAARIDFCKIGTRKTKIRLNSYSRTNDFAKVLKLLLEIEDSNLNAQKYPGYTKLAYYQEKADLLQRLLPLCYKFKLRFGTNSNTSHKSIKNVFFVEIGGIQICWLYMDEVYGAPDYEGEWDGLLNSTLGKIEHLILQSFPFINEKRWQLTKSTVKAHSDSSEKNNSDQMPLLT